MNNIKCQYCSYTVRQRRGGNTYYCLACGAVQTCQLCGNELTTIHLIDDIQVCEDCKGVEE